MENDTESCWRSPRGNPRTHPLRGRRRSESLGVRNGATASVRLQRWASLRNHGVGMDRRGAGRSRCRGHRCGHNQQDSTEKSNVNRFHRSFRLVEHASHHWPSIIDSGFQPIDYRSLSGGWTTQTTHRLGRETADEPRWRPGEGWDAMLRRKRRWTAIHAMPDSTATTGRLHGAAVPNWRPKNTRHCGGYRLCDQSSRVKTVAATVVLSGPFITRPSMVLAARVLLPGVYGLLPGVSASVDRR